MGKIYRVLILFSILFSVVCNGQTKKLFVENNKNISKSIEIPIYSRLNISSKINTDQKYIKNERYYSGILTGISDSSITMHIVNSYLYMSNKELKFKQIDVSDNISNDSISIRISDISEITVYSRNKKGNYFLNKAANYFIGAGLTTSLFVAPFASIKYSTGKINEHVYYSLVSTGLIMFATGYIIHKIHPVSKTYHINAVKETKKYWTLKTR
ncbi:MAG: hypothetical protein Q8880_05335 [Bacteroidota bacterium]|nr:hypothetical protein [Bacteroidota bacterium]